MNSKIKLGPLAIFLAIITIILVMLALLNHVTATADVALAERYAEVTKIKYELEEQGSRFLQTLDTGVEEAAPEVATAENETTEDEAREAAPADTYLTHTEKNGDYTLTIDYTLENGSYHVKRWRITKEWEETNVYENILQ